MAQAEQEYSFYRVKFIKKIQETEDIYTFLFSKPEDFSWHEGDYMRIAFEEFLEGDGTDLTHLRYMSIATLEKEDMIGITTHIGHPPSPYKRKLKEIKMGDTMIINHGASNFRLRREDRSILLLSMGVGLAAFRPLVISASENMEGIESLTSMTINRSEEPIYGTVLNQATVNHHVTISHVTSRQVFYQQIEDYLRRVDNPMIYMVGSYNFLVTLSKFLINKGIDTHDLYIDSSNKQMFFDTL